MSNNNRDNPNINNENINNQNLSNEYAQEITVNNNSYVPVGSKIKSITINIIGNTNEDIKSIENKRYK